MQTGGIIDQVADHVSARASPVSTWARADGEHELESAMMEFYEKSTTSVCTTIIESGDVPNVNTISSTTPTAWPCSSISSPERGSSNRQAYAYLLYRRTRFS